MASLSPEVQDVCAVITQWCLALISGEWKISDALTWSTCSPQKCISVTCAQGALNARKMPHYCNGHELQYWTWDYLRYVKVNEADSVKVLIQSSQMSPVQQVPVTNALAGAALLCPAGCKSRVSPSSPTRIFTHLPNPLTRASRFLSLLLHHYKWQQTQTLNLLLSWIWHLPALETYVLAPLWHTGGGLPTTSAHVKVPMLQLR